MKRIRRAVFQMMFLLTILGSAAFAASGYDLSWWSIDGGGAMNLSGGVYSLSGTVGQPDAGKMKGGSYELTGGIWGPAYYKNAAQYWMCYE